MWAKLKRFFTNRWVLSVVGLLIVSLIIWFAGDAIAIYDRRPLGPVWIRLSLIALIWLLWGHPMVALVIAAGASFAIHQFFVQVLLVPLPWGIVPYFKLF